MESNFVIHRNQYYDSVFLMGVNRRISEVKGVQQTAVLMGSPANKKILEDIGFHNLQIDDAQPNDLVVAITAESAEIVESVLGHLDEWLNASQEGGPLAEQIRTFEEGLARKPQANLAVISVPGEYAARETKKALEAGLNVFLFSDNVSVEDELELKTLAAKKGLLVMGPDCGTSILAGRGIGFANVVRRGSIGVIGAAGTGLQEFTSAVHNAGYGISHAIGTGSRDLSAQISGLTTFAALNALEADQTTRVITIISKPPADVTLEKLFRRIAVCSKPVIGCFLGVSHKQVSGKTNLLFARTIDDAMRLAVEADGGQPAAVPVDLSEEDATYITRELAARSSEQQYLRGILAGGTFCYQTQQILRQEGIPVYSNSPFDPHNRLVHPDHSVEHTLVDMGDEFYMVGRPHPMIDGTMRSRRILAESRDPEVAVLYLDIILGYNASMDPVGELVDAIQEARKVAARRGGSLAVVASICGTAEDPQDLPLQVKMLREAGALVLYSNARASYACCRLLGKG